MKRIELFPSEFQRLFDGIGDLTGFRHRKAILAFAVADHDESRETDVLATLDSLGYPVNVNDTLLVFLVLIAEATAATAPLARTAFMVTELAIAGTAGRLAAVGFKTTAGAIAM